MKKLFLAIALCFATVCCKEPSPEPDYKADTKEDCDLPEDITPTGDLTSHG